MSVFSERKEQMLIMHPYDEVVSERKYNAVLGGTILWGIGINILLCYFCGDLMFRINPIAFYLGYFLMVIAGTIITIKSSNPYVSFLGYNMVVLPVGLVVASAVTIYGGLDSSVVLHAFMFTGIITGCMITLSIAYPGFFARIGGLLFGVSLGMMICWLLSWFFGFDTYWYSWLGAILFSLYIGYDYWRAQTYVKTVDNAVDSAASIYLDIVNLFLHLLRIFGRSDD
jgi:FtsH-binding integral membrane protein